MTAQKDINQYRTLLLDSSFRPLRTIPWHRALTLDFQNKVLIVETYDRVVRSPSCSFQVPAVISLKQYLRFRPARVRYSKRNVFYRDDLCCQYCGCCPGLHKLTLDHVLPSSRGGLTRWENTVAACEACNHHKGNKTPVEAGMPLRTVPVRPKNSTYGFIGPHTPPEEWVEYLAS